MSDEAVNQKEGSDPDQENGTHPSLHSSGVAVSFKLFPSEEGILISVTFKIVFPRFWAALGATNDRFL